jgi:hypothetical protein
MIITLIGRFQPPLFIVTVSTKWIRPDPQQQQATSRVLIFGANVRHDWRMLTCEWSQKQSN